MLKKRQRLSKRQFDEIFRSGKRYHSPLFQLIYTDQTGFSGAVVVGKKVHKRAVDRNRLRRRVYNILYRLSKDKGLTGTYIIITKPTAAPAGFNDLKTAVEQLLKNLEPRT